MDTATSNKTDNKPACAKVIPKGDMHGVCFRKACDNDGATWYNSSTRKYYCKPCAMRIMSYPENAGLLVNRQSET